jgi:G3E family GTPase
MVAKTFSVADDSGFTLAQSATLQGLVAVVSVGELLAAPQTVREAVERIELATVVLMDSTGADDPARQRAERIVAALNPDAHLVWSGDDTAAGADGDPHTTAPFDLDAAQDRAALQDLLYGDGAGETEHVQRFAFRARRPFHPGRLQRWLSAGWPGLVRVRGQFWVCTAPHVAADMDIALGDAKTTMGGHWWAAVPEDNRPSEPAFVAYLQQVWDPTFGDRRQELAFVGTGVNPTTLLRSLEGCLLTQDELTTPGLWENEPHPFPWPDGGV